MSDEDQGVIQAVDTPTQSVPSDISQVQESDQSQAQTQPSEQLENSNNEIEDSAPKDNAAWAAQRVHAKQLKEENERLKQAMETIDPAYLESLRGATSPNNVYTQPELAPLNEDAEYSQVTQQVNYAQREAMRANQQIAKLQAQLELQQDRQAEEAFPELKTDKQFQQIVAEKKLAARVLGHDRTTYDIAREVNSLLNRREQQVAIQTEAKVRQQEVERKIAMAEPVGVSTQGVSANTDADFKNRVRKGDLTALEEMSKRIMGDLEIY